MILIVTEELLTLIYINLKQKGRSLLKS